MTVLVLAGSASARNAYVANSGSGTVSVIDTGTSSATATVSVGGEPVDVAITPDGTRAYVANKGTNTVAVIDTATHSQVGTIAVGKEPSGIAIAPGGGFGYVSNFGDESVSLFSTATNSVPIGPIQVGKEPQGVAFSPDGSLVYVALKSGGVAAIDTTTNAVVGTIPDALGPARIALGPRGGRGFVTDGAASSVTAFNPATRAVVGSPIATGLQPAGIAIAPDGKIAYVASPGSGTVTPIDIAAETPLNSPIGGFPGATGVAVRPDGLQGYVTDGTGSSVTILDTASTAPVGSIGVGSKPTGVAFVPNQGPRAAFFVSPTKRRAKQRLTFHGAGSTDRDGKVENYLWDFGDGGRIQGGQSTRVHRYRKPGEYLATLTVTDDEGCSKELVYTGQTASCAGSPAASTSVLVVVSDVDGPALRLSGPRRQRLGGSVVVLARCPREPCTLRASGAVVTAVEGRGVTQRRRLRLRPASSPLLTRSLRKLRLRLPRAGRRAAARALRRGGKAKAMLSVVALDEAGVGSLRRRTVTLVLPRRRR